MKRKLTITRNFLDSVLRSCLEIGYEALSEYEQEVCDAYDAGQISIIEAGGRNDDKRKP